MYTNHLVLIYFVPYSYGFRSRARGLLNITSFFIIFAAPVMIVCAFFMPSTPESLQNLIYSFPVALTATYCIYETGYICNDVLTTRSEKHPNIRIPRKDHESVCLLFVPIIASRLFYAAMCLSILHFRGMNVLPFFCALLMMRAFFSLHNAVRSRANIFTYLVLCLCKYCAILFLYLENPEIASGANSLFFAFVLPRTLEHASKQKYGISFLQNMDHDKFRIIYYSILSAICALTWIAFESHLLLLLLSLWFLSYRSVSCAYLGFRPNIRSIRHANRT